MILAKDTQKCTGETKSGVNCHMKQNCKRYLSYTLDDEVYTFVSPAPNCIEFTPLNCPLKIEAHKEK
jgi:hypothetical protein